MSEDLSQRSEVPQIEVTIENKGPVPSAHLGDLLSSIAADYKLATNGRTLVLVETRANALHFRFEDIMTALKGAEPHAKLAATYLGDLASITAITVGITAILTNLAKAKDAAIKASPPVKLPPARSVGMRTFRSLAKLIQDSDAEITVALRHERLKSVRFTPSDLRGR